MGVAADLHVPSPCVNDRHTHSTSVFDSFFMFWFSFTYEHDVRSRGNPETASNQHELCIRQQVQSPLPWHAMPHVRACLFGL